jgi:mannose-6-phosphate isomerase
MRELFKRKRPRAEPIRPARVYRFYRGGTLIGRLRRLDEPDGDRPEEWIGSITPASNPGRDEPEAGLARLEDGTLLRDALAEDPEGWLGRGHVERFGSSTGLLVKLLDAADRLPVHAHPDRSFAREHLGSPFGKTEAWIVLATRGEDAEVRVGLSEPVDPDTYRGWIERRETERLHESLAALRVRAGDVVYVPAGVPHAIGAGALIAELQEPTDFSLLCEWEGFPIDPDASHLGLGWDVAVGALDLEPHAPALGLPDEARAFFWADEEPEPAGRFAILLVLEGAGTIDGRPVGPGDAFALPAAAERLDVEGDLRVLRCLAPEV